MEAVKIVHSFSFQPKLLVQFFQRLAAIGFKIPKRMVEVEEKMAVFHGPAFIIRAKFANYTTNH
jgi:hypothetical protein